MSKKDHKTPSEEHNGVCSESPKDQRRGKKLDKQLSIPNGVRSQMEVVCPEMCCYCFDVLISHLTNTNGSRNPFLKFFTNDE